MQHIMLDLETLGTQPGSVILSIGAVFFDHQLYQLGAKFYQIISLAASNMSGFTTEESAIAFWEKQSKTQSHNDYQLARNLSPRYSVYAVLEDFAQFLHAADPLVGIWGKGADFDNVLLSAAYHRFGLKSPWHYRANRCYRTLAALYPEIKYEQTGPAHSAIHDACSQAWHVMEILRHMDQLKAAREA